MIPFAAEIGIRNHWRRPLQLWIPLALLWILLLPVVILLLPLFLIACLAGGISPFRAVAVLWNILTSLDDTEFSVDKPERSFSVHLY
ncbi:MAG: hypothetical protein ABSF98_06095 [Bryobacteraceae bacterium]|jgi:hypothetical protein